MSYEFLISLRYLRAKRKQVFVSIISFISVAGILLGVAALIIVLAVMNGFETDLRNKILGINSHIVITAHSGPMNHLDQVADKISVVKGVEATTPFIYSQAMIKSGSQVSGLILRGLDRQSAFKVLHIGKMKEGSFDYLEVENGPLSV